MSLRCDVAYVVQSEDGQVVKVGVSGNPKSRVYQITQTMPFPMRLVALVSGGKVAERQMKDILAPWKLRGEWFELRPELNSFLAQMRKENKLLVSTEVNEEFCEKYIKPALVEYMNGRQPSMSTAGDLVYRFFREGHKVIAGRMDTLHTGIKGYISAELLAGFVPLPQDAETPSVVLAASKAKQAEAVTS